MVGYSELLQSMAAMVLFSLILLTSNRMILLNSQKEVESEVERKAIAIAQSYIDEARTLPFDENAVTSTPSIIPDDFSDSGPEAGETTRADFDDFDDYHNWAEDVDWVTGSGDNAFRVNIDILYVTAPNYYMSTGTTNTYTEYKKMEVTVTSDYLKDNAGNNIKITLPYLRKYFKQ